MTSSIRSSAYVAGVVGLLGCALAMAVGACDPRGDDDDTASTDDDDDSELEPGGQIEGPQSLDLGIVHIGNTATGSVEIHNTGIQPLLIEDVMVVGNGADRFSTDFAGRDVVQLVGRLR